MSDTPAVRHQQFAELVAAGMPIYEISCIVGYSMEYCNRLARQPNVRSVIEQIVRSRVLTEGAPTAVNTLISIAKDSDSDLARTNAAKALLAAAAEARALEDRRSPDELSAAELDEMIGQLEARKASLARDITPVGAQPDRQAFDFLD